MWATIGVEPQIPWPINELSIPFMNHEIFVLPETETRAPCVAMTYEKSGDLDEALFALRQFLSCLAWAEGKFIREIMALGGSQRGGVGRGMHSPPYRPPLSPRLSIDHVPEPGDDKASLALALFREALGLENVAYKFLGFFKIINVLHAKGTAQIAWINSVLPHLEAEQARQRSSVLQEESTKDLGTYLYASGRCAIAHAYAEPLVNPDNPTHRARLHDDLPLVRALAEYVIEQEFGIPTARAVWRQHLYELEGFRKLLGPQLVATLRDATKISLNDLPNFPKLSIRVRHRDRMQAFEALLATPVEVDNGSLLVRCVSDDQCVEVHLVLDFAEERLKLDPVFGVTLHDNGTARAMSNVVDQVSLIEGLFNNGELGVWDAVAGERLGRCDPYIPLNIDVRASLQNFKSSAGAAAAIAEQRSNGAERAKKESEL